MGSDKPRRGFRRPKRIRLTRSTQYQKVRNEGKTRAGQFIRLSYFDTGATSDSLLGIVVPRKVGSAPERNLIRRRLREIHRLHQHEIRAGLWIVVLAYPSAKSATYHDLEQEWLRLGNTLGILR